MSIGTLMASAFGAGTGTSLAKTLATSKASDAMGSAITDAGFESEMEVGAEELNKIDKEKKAKLRQLDGEMRKNIMTVNEKNASLIQF
jgi:hypothetical protein